MECSLLDSSVRGSIQARILEWVAIPFSKGSSWHRDWTQVSCIAGRFFTIWDAREVILFSFFMLHIRSPGPVNSTSYKSLTCRHTSPPPPLFKSLYLVRTSMSPSPPTFHTLEATPPKLLLRYSLSDFSVFFLWFRLHHPFTWNCSVALRIQFTLLRSGFQGHGWQGLASFREGISSPCFQIPKHLFPLPSGHVGTVFSSPSPPPSG